MARRKNKTKSKRKSGGLKRHSRTTPRTTKNKSRTTPTILSQQAHTSSLVSGHNQAPSSAPQTVLSDSLALQKKSIKTAIIRGLTLASIAIVVVVLVVAYSAYWRIDREMAALGVNSINYGTVNLQERLLVIDQLKFRQVIGEFELSGTAESVNIHFDGKFFKKLAIENLGTGFLDLEQFKSTQSPLDLAAKITIESLAIVASRLRSQNSSNIASDNNIHYDIDWYAAALSSPDFPPIAVKRFTSTAAPLSPSPLILTGTLALNSKHVRLQQSLE